MEWIKLSERREAGHSQIIMGSEYIKNQPASNTPRTRWVHSSGIQFSATNIIISSIKLALLGGFLNGWKTWIEFSWISRWPHRAGLQLWSCYLRWREVRTLSMCLDTYLCSKNKNWERKRLAKLIGQFFKWATVAHICQSNSSLLQTVDCAASYSSHCLDWSLTGARNLIKPAGVSVMTSSSRLLMLRSDCRELI